MSPSNSDLDPPGQGLDPDGASGGRINGLASVAGNNQTFYAASEWGGLFKTTDGGVNWFRLDRHLPTVGWDVEVDPGNVGTVYATSFYDGRVNSNSGIQVSYDAGVTWTHPASATPLAGFACTNPLNEPRAFGIGIRPDAAQNVFIGTSCGVARSTNAGVSWTFIDPTTPPGTASNVWDVVVQGGGQGIVDICGDKRHRRSTDGGATWTGGSAQLPAGRCSIAVSPDEPYVLLVAASDNNIYESDDAGANWTNLGTPDPIPQGRIPFVATNQRANAGQNNVFDLWFGDVRLYRGTCTTPANAAPGGAQRCPQGFAAPQGPGSQKNLPAGGLWAGPFTRNAGAHDDAGDLVFDRQAANDACPEIFSSDGGVYFNTDNGADCHNPNWDEPTVTPHALWLFAMAGFNRAGNDPEDLYFGLQDNGTWANNTIGAANPVGTWHNEACCDSFDFVSDGTQVVRSFCCAFSIAVCDTDLIPCNNIAAANQPPGCCPSFFYPDFIATFGVNRFAAATGSGLFITNNITDIPNNAWTELGPASNLGFCAVQVAMSAGVPTFYAQQTCGTDQQNAVWKYSGTVPGGTWTQVDNTDGLAGGFGIFAVDPNNPNRLYASHLGGLLPQMVFSTDGGLNWDRDQELEGLMAGVGLLGPGAAFRNPTQSGQDHGPGNAVTNFNGYFQPSLLAFDAEAGNVLAAGGQDSGVFISTDGGQTWGLVTDPINSGNSGVPHLPRPRFAYFDHEPAGEAQVYIGTQGRGVWRLSLPTADLSIFKSDSPDPVKGGDNLFYTITVFNDGPDDAPNVRVVDNLPAGVKFIKDDRGVCTQGPLGVIDCNLGDLANGASTSVTIRTKVNVLKTSLQNTARVSSGGGLDPNLANNTATATTIVKTCKSGQPETDNVPPVVQPVNVSASPLKGKPITFTATATDNCDTPEQLHYKWTFDDGGSAFGQTVDHTFADEGTHSGSVRVTDRSGNEAARDFSLTVGINGDTNIKYEGPIGVGPNDPDPIELSAVLVDHDGRPIKGRTLQFSIRQPDGVTIVVGPLTNVTDVNGRARVMLRPPEAQGQYRVFVVFKGDGVYDPAEFSKKFTVFDNQPPVVSALPQNLKAPWGVPIEFSGFATDPDGSAPETLKYVWDFGHDGQTAINQKVSHAFPPFPPPPDPATLPHDYHVTLTVTDKDGASTEVSTDVTINKRPTTIQNCGETQIVLGANKVELCARLLVADLDGGDSEAGVKGKALQFRITDSLNKLITSADTDAKGETRPTVMVNLAQGCYPAHIVFKGDDLYKDFRYDYVFYTVGAGRITGPVVQCSLSVSHSSFALLDSDGDSCANGQEAGKNVVLGGLRDPNDVYDFFDVPVGDPSGKDKIVSALDVLSVVARFGATGDPSGSPLIGPIPAPPAYHPAFDRTAAGPEPWRSGAPNGSITIEDIGLAVAQFGHSCA